MTEEIKFSRQTISIGRNGNIITSGVEILKNSIPHTISIQPLTSKGVPANCMIDIPVENIDELIKALQTVRY